MTSSKTMPSEFSVATIKRLRWLQGILLKYPHRFDQSDWCGTQACLAGFCLPRVFGSRKVTLDYSDLPDNYGMNPLSVRAAGWLGISMGQKYILFAANWQGEAAVFNRSNRDTDEQAAAKAIKRIDLFIESGGRR